MSTCDSLLNWLQNPAAGHVDNTNLATSVLPAHISAAGKPIFRMLRLLKSVGNQGDAFLDQSEC